MKFLVHPAFFNHITCCSHTLQNFEKKIVTLSRVIGTILKEFYTRKFGFEVLGFQYQGVL